MPAPTKRPTNPAQRSKQLLANSLVALSSAAVFAVYAAGYARTAPAAADLAATAVPPTTPIDPTATIAPATATASPTSTATAAATSTTAKTASTATAPTSTAPAASVAPTASVAPAATSTTITTTTAAYTDGTYSGTGTSRHGNITVAVTIQGGKIVSAEITTCGTKYPCSRIAALPSQVVARQSAAVDLVSGATDSTNAYRAAVNAALAQAR